MNKFDKAMIAFLGGINTAFSIAIPILISLLVISNIDLSQINQWMLLIIGCLSSIYRGLKVWII